jgi:two-component system response regulator YesN
LVHRWCKVLIVDDELLIRQGIKHSIDWEQEGFQIIGEASNGKEALDLIEEKQPHIVITDMVMPVMDGEELTRVIKRDYPQIEIIILSSFGDFDYVRSTFQHGIADYILKPQLEGPEFLKALKQAAERIPGFTLRAKETTVSIERVIDKLLAGYDIDKDASIIQQAFPYQYYSLFGVDFKNSMAYKNTDLQPFVKEIEQKLEGSFTNMVYQHILIEKNIVVFLFNFEDYQLNTIKRFVRGMADSIYLNDQEVGWVLTEPFSYFADLKRNYQDNLLSLINYRFFLPQERLLIYDQMPSIPQIEEHFQLTQFTEYFKREQFANAFLYLEDHIQIFSQQYTMDEFAFKSFLNNIIFNITTLLGNMKYESDDLEREKYTYIATIDEALVAQDALEQWSKFLEHAKEIIATNGMKKHHPNMQRLLDYIDKNYAETLNLTELGNYFHYNPSYLSNYFSVNYKQGFTEYLNQVRIEKSIELLENGTKSIAEISVLVGYSDHSYFSRVFKNLIGKSPSNYRKQYFIAKENQND